MSNRDDAIKAAVVGLLAVSGRQPRGDKWLLSPARQQDYKVDIAIGYILRKLGAAEFVGSE